MEYDGSDSEEYDESSESEDLPPPASCLNCTNELEHFQQICPVGHGLGKESNLEVRKSLYHVEFINKGDKLPDPLHFLDTLFVF